MKRAEYVDTVINGTNEPVHYYAYTRCPYDKLVSAYFYKYPQHDVNKFHRFILTTLSKYKFDEKFHSSMIHFYPQYMFVCNGINEKINETIDIQRLEDRERPKKYDLSTFYNDECLSVVNQVYARDFAEFGYEIVDRVPIDNCVVAAEGSQ